VETTMLQKWLFRSILLITGKSLITSGRVPKTLKIFNGLFVMWRKAQDLGS